MFYLYFQVCNSIDFDRFYVINICIMYTYEQIWEPPSVSFVLYIRLLMKVFFYILNNSYFNIAE